MSASLACRLFLTGSAARTSVRASVRASARTQELSRVACVCSLACSTSTHTIGVRNFSNKPVGLVTAQGMPELPWDDILDPKNPDAEWGLPLAAHRGQVAWWDEEKGIGMILRLEDDKEFFVCKDNIKEDPFDWDDEETPYASVDMRYKNEDMSNKMTQFSYTIAKLEEDRWQNLIQQIKHQEVDLSKVAQHLYPEQLVWFDEDKTELGAIAVNVKWELGAFKPDDEPAGASIPDDEPAAMVEENKKPQ